MKTAVIYARYSSDSQTEQSIEGQLRVCQDYAKNNDILIVDTYIDRAMTGTNDMRPDFQRMIKDSNKRQWDYVLVYKLDRFSRNKYETTIHKHTLSNNGVKVISAMENIPDSPEGIILESLLEGMNQYYSAELSQKVLRGLNESYRKGNYTGGMQIFGYKVVDKKNVIDPFEAEIVQDFEHRVVRAGDKAPLLRALGAYAGNETSAAELGHRAPGDAHGSHVVNGIRNAGGQRLEHGLNGSASTRPLLAVG